MSGMRASQDKIATFKLHEAGEAAEAEGKRGGGAEGPGGNAPVRIAVGKALCSLSELQRVSCASATCTRSLAVAKEGNHGPRANQNSLIFKM